MCENVYDEIIDRLFIGSAKSLDEIEETEKQFNDIIGNDDDEPMDSESFDAGDLFN
jgi:hypothetical protein